MVKVVPGVGEGHSHFLSCELVAKVRPLHVVGRSYAEERTNESLVRSRTREAQWGGEVSQEQCPLSPQGAGLPAGEQSSGQSRPGVFWDCPRSCWKGRPSLAVPS